MSQIGVFEAKNKLSELIDRAERGEETVITRRGKPVAKLVPISAKHDVKVARAALQRIREQAKQANLGPFNWEEEKRYRDEGRE